MTAKNVSFKRNRVKKIPVLHAVHTHLCRCDYYDGIERILCSFVYILFSSFFPYFIHRSLAKSFLRAFDQAIDFFVYVYKYLLCYKS